MSQRRRSVNDLCKLSIRKLTSSWQFALSFERSNSSQHENKALLFFFIYPPTIFLEIIWFQIYGEQNIIFVLLLMLTSASVRGNRGKQ